MVRTHDDFYAREDPSAPTKDSFIQVANLIEQYRTKIARSISIVDYGCATGAFVNYLNTRFPNDETVGCEYLENLIQVGMRHYPGIRIRQGSVLDKDSLQESSIDVLTMLGVLSIFDDVERVLENITHWVRPGGKVLIHGMFNPMNVDVFVQYRYSEEYSTEEYESGWNIISQETVSKLLHRNGARNIQFHPFTISTDLVPNSEDPLRSWTERMADGSRQIVNGLWLKQPQFILEADL